MRNGLKYVLTIDELEIPLSLELCEKSYCKELISIDLFPDEDDLRFLRMSKSELVEYRGLIPDSTLSMREGSMRSMLGLSLLTNDMSVSDESSYDLFVEALPLVKGDL